MASETAIGVQPDTEPEIALLESVQRRVLWLAMSIIHHANKARQTPSGVKVGGHQASSSSIVSVMTALYFAHLRAPDRVSVKPHASPVLHAINYLLGRLEVERLHAELVGREGWSVRRFNDWMLSFGALPWSWIWQSRLRPGK